jgi:hypothetical protein
MPRPAGDCRPHTTSEHAPLRIDTRGVKHPIRARAAPMHCRPAPGSTPITPICMSPRSADMASAAAHSGGSGAPKPRLPVTSRNEGWVAAGGPAAPGKSALLAANGQQRPGLAVFQDGSLNGSAFCSQVLPPASSRSPLRLLTCADGRLWRPRLRECIPGGQGVAGSNPAVPTQVKGWSRVSAASFWLHWERTCAPIHSTGQAEWRVQPTRHAGQRLLAISASACWFAPLSRRLG